MKKTPKARDESGKDAARSAPEWITFIVACLIVSAIAGLMVVQAISSFDPAAPVAEQAGSVRNENGSFFVPVDVTNHGDETAVQVQVLAELTVDGEVTSGDQVIDFLAGDEVEHLTFVFDTDPADGELVVQVTGFSAP